MAYIEPIALQVNIEGDNPNLDVSDSTLDSLRWPSPYRWALSKSIGGSFDIIDRNQISRRIQATIQDLYANVSQIDNAIGDQLAENVMSMAGRSSFNNGIALYNDNVFILPNVQQSGYMFVVSKNQKTIDDTINRIIENIQSVSNIVSDFGMKIDVIQQKELAKLFSDDLDAELIRRNDFDNEFEETVYDDVHKNMTRCLDSNIELRFGNKDNKESFEYDIIIYLDKLSRVIIEVKDESHEESDLRKPKLIDKPRDKTDIIDSKKETDPLSPYPHRRYEEEQTECFVIVKDIDDHKFEQHQTKANRRDLTLLKYDKESNYLEKIENKIKDIIFV